jgi:hypothetical protein
MSDRAASDTSPGRDYAAVADLVLGARNGDQRAWDALVERYAPLIWSICRRHRLSDTDAEDIGRSIWLHLQTFNSRCPLVFYLVPGAARFRRGILR